MDVQKLFDNIGITHRKTANNNTCGPRIKKGGHIIW